MPNTARTRNFYVFQPKNFGRLNRQWSLKDKNSLKKIVRNGSNQSQWLYVGTSDISGGGLN